MKFPEESMPIGSTKGEVLPLEALKDRYYMAMAYDLSI